MINNSKNKGIFSLHRWSYYLTNACAIHCLATPLILVFFPLIGESVIHNIWIEIGILGSAFLISSFLVIRAYFLHHKLLWIPLSLIAVFTILVTSHFINQEVVEILLLFIGSIIIYYVLRTNQKLSVSCNVQP